MLKAPTPFPHVGSFALLVDKTLPIDQQRAELVRIMRHDPSNGWFAVAFPLRVGASGNRMVTAADLIDGTALDQDEKRELADLQRHLHGRERLTPKMKQQQVRAEALRQRAIFAVLLDSELRKLSRLEAKAQPSTGRFLPREAA